MTLYEIAAWSHHEIAGTISQQIIWGQRYNRLILNCAVYVCSNFMENPLKLIPGQKYKVIKPFIDYDHRVHNVGETWIFVRTNFAPYDDGLTLHVLQENISSAITYRLQWLQDTQSGIIENFKEFVALA